MINFLSLRAKRSNPARRVFGASISFGLDCRVAALLAMTVFFAALPSYALEELSKDKSYKLASDFAECSAFYTSYASFFKKESKPDRSEYMLGMARGAEISSATIASKAISGKDAVKFTKASIQSHNAYMNDMFDSSDVEALDKHSKKCLKLVSLQNQIVEDSLKQTYGFKE